MHVSVQQFRINGPPSGIREGLIESGLVIPQALPRPQTKVSTRPRLHIPEKPVSKALSRNTSQNVRHTQTFTPMKFQYPSTTKKNTQNTQNTQETLQLSQNSLLTPNRCRTAISKSRLDRFDSIKSYNSTTETDEFDFISKEMKRKGFVSRKESKMLYDQITKLSDSVNEEISSLKEQDPDCKISNVLESYIDRFYLFWDDLIMQIKVSNADHAASLCLIKSYMQGVNNMLPEISKNYETKISQLQDVLSNRVDELNKSKDEIEDMQQKNKEINLTLLDQNVKIDDLRLTIKNLQEEKVDLLYKIDELKQKNTDSGYRLTKLGNINKQMTKKIDIDTESIQEMKQQNTKLEEIVKKYEEEGASYRPMYKKASEDLAEAQTTIEKQKEEIEKLSYKPPVVDVGVSVVMNIPKPVEVVTRKKRSGTMRGERPQIPILDNAFKFSKHPENISALNHSSGLGSERSSSKAKKLKSPSAALFKPPRVTIEIPEPDKEKKEVKVEEKKVTIVAEKPVEKPEKKPEEKPEKKEEKVMSSSRSDSSLESTLAYPEGYTFNPEQIPSAPAFRTYLFKILPTAINEYNDNGDFYNVYTTTKEVNVKSLAYTLGITINILRNGFEFNSDLVSEKAKFKEIIRQSLIKNGINNEILDKTESMFMVSAVSYRSVSKTIDFFLKFAGGEFSLADFAFFNILFSLAFNSLYPNVEQAVNPDIKDDSVSFLFPIEGIDRICSILLPERTVTQQMKDQLTKKSNFSYNSMVSFWDFSTMMIGMFDEVHATFHLSIKNIFKILDTSNAYNVSETVFREFSRIIIPTIDDKTISQLWLKINLFASEMASDNINYNVFVHFFGDLPQFCEAILKIPKNSYFESNFRTMQDLVENLFNFLRKRYTDFLPKLKRSIPPELRVKVDPLITKIRNSLIKCDSGSSYVYYRHILQLIDLYLTEKAPFIQFTATVTQQELNELINITIEREKLITGRLEIN